MVTVPAAADGQQHRVAKQQQRKGRRLGNLMDADRVIEIDRGAIRSPAKHHRKCPVTAVIIETGGRLKRQHIVDPYLGRAIRTEVKDVSVPRIKNRCRSERRFDRRINRLNPSRVLEFCIKVIPVTLGVRIDGDRRQGKQILTGIRADLRRVGKPER